MRGVITGNIEKNVRKLKLGFFKQTAQANKCPVWYLNFSILFEISLPKFLNIFNGFSGILFVCIAFPLLLKVVQDFLKYSNYTRPSAYIEIQIYGGKCQIRLSGIIINVM